MSWNPIPVFVANATETKDAAELAGVKVGAQQQVLRSALSSIKCGNVAEGAALLKAAIEIAEWARSAP